MTTVDGPTTFEIKQEGSLIRLFAHQKRSNEDANNSNK